MCFSSSYHFNISVLELLVSQMQKLAILISLFLFGCVTVKDPKLVGGEGQLYVGGMINQRVQGDGNQVSVWNIWNAKDGLPFAQQYCQQFGKTVSSKYRFSGVTGYYTCKGLSDDQRRKIFEKAEVRDAISGLSVCIRKNVVFLDDLSSDAKTISEGVAQACGLHWNRIANAYVKNLPNSDKLGKSYVESIRSAFVNGRVSKVLPYVLTWRSIIKNGWNEKESPSEREIPDSLFPKGT